jgi:hypothetical protein
MILVPGVLAKTLAPLAIFLIAADAAHWDDLSSDRGVSTTLE